MLFSLERFPKEKTRPLKERMGFSVKPVHNLGNPATHHCRAGGFASHSFERFAFLPIFLSEDYIKNFRKI